MSFIPAGSEWEQFLRQLDLAEGFTVLILHCPSVQDAEAVREALAAHAATQSRQLDWLGVTTTEHVRQLPERLLEPLPDPRGDVLWVSLYFHPNPTGTGPD